MGTTPTPAGKPAWKNLAVAGSGIGAAVVAAVLTAFSGWAPAQQAQVVTVAVIAAAVVAVAYIVTDRWLDVVRPRKP